MTFDESTLKAAVAKSMLEAMTPEVREALLKEAITALTTPPQQPHRFGSAPTQSRIQEIFEQEVWIIAREEIKKAFAEDPKVRAMVATMCEKAMLALVTSESAADDFARIVAGMIRRVREHDER